MDHRLSPGCVLSLKALYFSWLRGSTGLEIADTDHLPKTSKWYSKEPRRMRILEKLGYAREVKALQGRRWLAYQITMKGVVAWDLLTLRGNAH